MTGLNPSSYDVVIVGAGVSGLCLAHALAQRQPDTSVLIIDRDPDPDYNISFWSTEPTPFEPIMIRSWKRIAVRLDDETRTCDLHRYTLRAFWRADFDRYLRDQLDRAPGIQHLEANVTTIDECGDHAEISADAHCIHAKWVFDSRLNIGALRSRDPDLMLMQGLAWEIETPTPVFDPEVATLFDFLTETTAFDFIYSLPYTPTWALVNCAYVTPYETAVTREHCEEVLRAYLRDRLHLTDYTLKKACYGRIPLTSKPFERKPGSRIVPIGVRGGMVKPSTSYAFARILHDAEQMADALVTTGTPYYRDHTAWYYRWADEHMGHVFHQKTGLAQRLMMAMFNPDSGDGVLSFLDERNTLAENRALFRAIPPRLIRQLLRALVFG